MLLYPLKGPTALEILHKIRLHAGQVQYNFSTISCTWNNMVDPHLKIGRSKVQLTKTSLLQGECVFFGVGGRDGQY